MKSCLKCKFLKIKDFSKRDDTYGFCEKTKMPMLAVQDKCKFFEQIDADKKD